uniref:Adenylate kinase n=1 Tax=candidate division CPR3 bacterium TaxID=2268181 RepID=A0A7C5US95_UNCC3
MIFSLIGPPASGKTTNSILLGERLKIPVIHIGDLLRQKLSSPSRSSENIKSIMKKGGLVSSSLIKRLIFSWIRKNDIENGFIFDGFPRRFKDVNLLHNEILPKIDICSLPFVGVFNLDISLREAVKRVSIRSRVKGERVDDKLDITKKRYDIYIKNIEKIKNFYSSSLRWFSIPGEREVSDIQKTLESLIGEQKKFRESQIILILGAAGSGKDTQAQMLSSFGYDIFSSGEAFRKEIAKKTKLGKLIKEKYINKGKLVPDIYHKDVIYKQIAEILDKGKKIVLTGVVRTLKQAKILDEYLAHRGDVVKNVILLDVPRKMLIERLSLRMVCPKCGFNYNLKYLPPKKPGICDRDGTKLVRREDETREAVNVRLKEQFYDVIKPILSYYKNTKRLHIVDGRFTPDKVFKLVRKALEI